MLTVIDRDYNNLGALHSVMIGFNDLTKGVLDLFTWLYLMAIYNQVYSKVKVTFDALRWEVPC